MWARCRLWARCSHRLPVNRSATDAGCIHATPNPPRPCAPPRRSLGPDEPVGVRHAEAVHACHQGVGKRGRQQGRAARGGGGGRRGAGRQGRRPETQVRGGSVPSGCCPPRCIPPTCACSLRDCSVLCCSTNQPINTCTQYPLLLVTPHATCSTAVCMPQLPVSCCCMVAGSAVPAGSKAGAFGRPRRVASTCAGQHCGRHRHVLSIVGATGNCLVSLGRGWQGSAEGCHVGVCQAFAGGVVRRQQAREAQASQVADAALARGLVAAASGERARWL